MAKAKDNVGVGAGMDDGGLVFDLESVEEDKGFELIPKGTYSAVVDDVEYGESKAGNKMMTVIFSLTDPEFENRKLYDFYVLEGDGKPFGLAKLKKFLVRACPDVAISNFNPQTFAEEGTGIGRECRVKLKIQTQKSGEYKGEKRNQIADVLAPDNAGMFL